MRDQKVADLVNNLLERPVPKEIPLENPPLKSVLAQIRFPTILSVNQHNSSMVASFQEAVREEYPEYILRVQELQNAVGPSIELLHHRFRSADGWEITLNSDFVALATNSKFKTNADFASRIEAMCKSVQECIKPGQVTRLGIRFIDRVEGDALEKIQSYVKSDFLGALARFSDRGISLVTQGVMTHSDTTLVVRWGWLPPEHVIPQQTMIPSIEEPCWFLDSDIHSSVVQSNDFNPGEIASKAEKLAGQVYAVFREVFTDGFIRSCGGNP